MSINVSDLRPTIVPKSDQLNAEQLLAGPMVITVTNVAVANSAEQPVTIHYDGEDGRPYKPCKTMRKVLLYAWGQDGRDWVGKSVELYNDPAVRFGGVDVGGIRIARLSDIPKPLKISLTATKGKKALYEIGKLQAKPARSSDKHTALVADLEKTAKELGLDALRSDWNALSKADKAAIGTDERDRIILIAEEVAAAGDAGEPLAA